MASIFTFDPDPPRVSSPWSTPREITPNVDGARNSPLHSSLASFSELSLSDEGQALGLQAEPQEGPTEYKLHLLLRPRRSFHYMSTVNQIPGSYRSGALVSNENRRSSSRSPSSTSDTRSARPAASSHTYQHRLQQLTTQLLWRLQQSSSYHATASHQSSSLRTANSKALDHATFERINPHPGLENSKGALYEIGVSDDGTLVGLARDEMDESLQTLSAMAASLGCVVEVLRMIPVGECEWNEKTEISHQAPKIVHKSKLWVAEAYVKPAASDRDTMQETTAGVGHVTGQLKNMASLGESSQTPQMRVSLIGATMSGKSSLLGTLAHSTLDNGRGKSRLSLLKHQHEIASGITSSVAQELIGYTRYSSTETSATSIKAINCASDRVSSWADIHASAKSRLVFLLDSAGHSRYRRTAVRSLMGWAPHWILLCVAGDEVMDRTCGQDRSNSLPKDSFMQSNRESDDNVADIHLKLCLDLGKPLVIVITRLDLAAKKGLRLILAKLLSKLKNAGRKPILLSEGNGSGSGVGAGMENDFQTVLPTDVEEMRQLSDSMQGDLTDIVPIVLTSAVRGTGISKLHALLSQLPIPSPLAPIVLESCSNVTIPTQLFQIDDHYDFSASRACEDGQLPPQDVTSDESLILSGYVQSGRIQVGMALFLGPFSRLDMVTDLEGTLKYEASSTATRASMNAIFDSHSNTSRSPKDKHGNSTNQEWRKVQITSIRTLRLSVNALLADQVGTIGVVAADVAAPLHRVRKGMVLINFEDSRLINGIVSDYKQKIVNNVPLASQGCIAKIYYNVPSQVVAPGLDALNANRETDIDSAASALNLMPGSDALLCIASVRAAAKIVSVRFCDDDDSIFSRAHVGAVATQFNDHQHHRQQQRRHLSVSFRFNTTSEFVLPGTQILVIPGSGGQGGAGLDGLVGRVIGRLSN